MSLQRTTILLAIALACSACSSPSTDTTTAEPASFPPGTTVDFEFESGGVELSGVLDVPTHPSAQALILFVHGYGQTDVRGWDMYAELRDRFTELGIATATWDKPGQGRSEGSFDIDQPVSESAQEVVDAAAHLRQANAPGSEFIGIWGVSRAGWIAPLALTQDEKLEFWISVSGVTAEDNFTYLLLSNLPYEGGTQEEAMALADEWRAGCETLRTGGSYDAYQRATETLRANDYINRMRGSWPTKSEYEAQQESCTAGSCPNVDDEMCSYVWIEEFDAMLAALNIDVLALFGEKDRNVDWRKTLELYERSIGRNPHASLEIKRSKTPITTSTSPKMEA